MSRSWQPITKSMVAAGMARRRMGGSWGVVPLLCVSVTTCKTEATLRNQFNHDKEPSKRQIPVEPVEIPSLGANDPADRLLLP